MAATLTVRDAEPADADGIAAIGRVAIPDTFEGIVDPLVLRSIVEQSYSIEALSACIARCRRHADAHFMVAELKRRVVGFLHYDCDGPEPELHRIYVKPALKRQGIGTALLKELHAPLPTGSSYILMVIAGNQPAVNFYRRHGLVVAAEVDGPAYMSEHMGVSYPEGTQPAPALLMRFTKSTAS